ncbi:MAG: preprotein translocase subunit SecA [Bdellovibrionales bacterium]|nr:preprotein translocase subunit SecA [Bdellovibrionales bacterium]
MIETILKKIFGSSNDRYIRSLRPLIVQVNDLERKYRNMQDDDLKAQTTQFRERLDRGESLDSIKPEAFAVVRESAKRVLEMRHFDVQLVGGNVLHEGKIAEMKTGEGKTLVATLPAYLNGLTGKGVHVVTVNDYLARRDAEWMGQVYRFLGLSVGVVLHGLDEDQKREAYRSDITYGQNNEFGFDYLRDNMKFSSSEMMQRGHHFAIVDEVDSILIDEARTPLIISGPAEDATDKYYIVNKIIPKLVNGEDYEVDLKTKQPMLSEDGVAHAERLLEIDNLYDPNNIDMLHHVNIALKAHTSFERDVDYVVRDGQIIIVDEFTGRLMPGRRWSNGQHQAIEAKEGLQIARENQTLASVTFQNYFRMYEKLSGMTGTADTEAGEFLEIYKLPVVVIPTNKPMIRDDQTDLILRSRVEKYEAVADDIEEINKSGQPILVGTISIEQSEALSRKLTSRNVPHNVLNAKHHEREAEIVAQAGRLGAVTIATNMAGRGTDIMLGGNPEALAAQEVGTRDHDDPSFQSAYEKYRAQCEEEKKKVIAAGGLFIIGTERHESRRIDNQLRGRAGRQGDPGASRFYVSLEDDLMKRFGGERLQAIMTRMGWEEGVAMDGRMLSRSIENAQRKVEGFHFESRKHVTEYDDVMNKQRQVIYNLRSKILMNEDIRGEVQSAVDDILESLVVSICNDREKAVNWNLDEIRNQYTFLTGEELEFPDEFELNQQAIFDFLRSKAWETYEARLSEREEKLRAIGDLPISVRISRDEGKPLEFTTVEQDTFLETLDYFWNQHLQDMDHLREGIGWRGYGQKNPKHEYQREGFLLFQEMLERLKQNVVRKLFYYEIPSAEELMAHIEEEERKRLAREEQMQLVHESAEGAEVESPDEEEPKDPDEVRAKRDAQRKARRKHRK